MAFGQFQNYGGYQNPMGVQDPYYGMEGNSQQNAAYPGMMSQSMNYNPYNGSNYTSSLWGGNQANTSGFGGAPMGASPSTSSSGSSSGMFGSVFNPQNAAWGAAGMASSLAGLFNNPYNAGNQYFNQIPGQLQNAFNPYMQEGQQLLPQLTGEFNQLTSNPAANLSAIGKTYQQSPGYQFQVNQATDAANRSAAAGGMVGSGANQVQTAGIANQLANQDYQQYMQNALGLQSEGLQGQMGLENQGYNAASQYGSDMSSYLSAMGGNAEQAAQNKNNALGGFFGSLFSLLEG